jgi:hypothetical protein
MESNQQKEKTLRESGMALSSTFKSTALFYQINLAGLPRTEYRAYFSRAPRNGRHSHPDAQIRSPVFQKEDQVTLFEWKSVLRECKHVPC